MPDFKKIVQERIASLHLEAAAESSLTEEFAQHLEDRYQELRADGATEHEAYREALSELDDLYPLCTELPTAGSDAVPAGDMLICSNDDRPGMVGILGSILAEARINIATLSLGRDHTGGKAIAIFNLDSPVEAPLLDRIRSLSGILWAESVQLRLSA